MIPSWHLFLLAGTLMVLVSCELVLEHKFYRSKVKPARIARMEKEAEQDPTMWCDEWFAAVCAVIHEREVENVTEYSRERHWDSDQMCREFNKLRGHFWTCYNKASHRCGRDIMPDRFRWFESWGEWYSLPDMSKVLDGTLDQPQTVWMNCRDHIPRE